MSNDNPFSNPNPFSTTGPPPAGYAPAYVPAPRMSVMALFSLLSAIASPFLLCLCIPSAVLALTSIVLGHTAIHRISKSPTTLGGRGLAFAGLVIAYPMLILSIALMVWAVTLPKGPDIPTIPNPARDGLDSAESAIISNTKGVAHGNTPEAEALAQKFAADMKSLREEFFTKRSKPTISLSGEEFVTYCELKPGKCAFVVHVPSYRKFSEDAKDTLAELAWKVAQNTVDGTLEKGDSLGVGLKGTILYGAVMVGKVGATDEDANLGAKTTNRENLLPFFEPERKSVVPEEPEGTIKLEDDPAKPPAESKPAETTSNEKTPEEKSPNEEAAQP